MNPLLEQVDLFCGEITPQRALVYARLERPDGDPAWRLSGRIRGPQSRFAQTLPSNSPFRDLGPGETLLASALVPDPCRWSPALPSCYDVELELRRGDQLVERWRQAWAIRQLVVQNSGLFLTSERTILRGARAATVVDAPLESWPATPLVCVVHGLEPALFQDALPLGCLIVADFSDADPASLEGSLRQSARHAAVGIVIVPESTCEWERLRNLAPNLLLAKRCRSEATPAGGDLLWWQGAVSASTADFLRASKIPSIVERTADSASPRISLAAARLACDQLQADWAPLAQFAGYVV